MTTKPICTCASFFTVRGVHKKDCPAYTIESWEKEFDRQFAEMYDDKDDGYAYNEVKSFSVPSSPALALKNERVWWG